MNKKLCGEPANGGPCTLPKGHKVGYHRHRVYQKVYWEIKTTMGKVLESGNARVPMNYAITRCFEDHDNLIISLKRYDSGHGSNDGDPSKVA